MAFILCTKTHELIILSKDGTGDVRRVKLATNDIDEEVVHRNYFVVRDKGFRDKKFNYIHNWEIRQFKVSFFNYQGELVWTDEMKREYCMKMMHSMPYLPMPDKNMEIIYYKGIFRDMHLFANVLGGQFFLTSFGDVQYSYKISGDIYFSVLPLSALNDEIDIESHLPSPEGSILRGTHCYYVGFEGANNRSMVVDIDFDKMFPEVPDWIKKMMN